VGKRGTRQFLDVPSRSWSFRRVERDALVIVLQYLEQMATVDFE
jgi:hypothetical protein